MPRVKKKKLVPGKLRKKRKASMQQATYPKALGGPEIGYWDEVYDHAGSHPVPQGTTPAKKAAPEASKALPAPKATAGTRCYDSHPPLPLKDGLVIYGGSCITPAVPDADVYVGLDSGMTFAGKRYPWNEGGKAVVETLFKIPDMGTPTDTAGFKKMIAWLVTQVEAGKKVHVGCIGGHGRTGMVLAALVSVMLGEKNAIQYVRQHYCQKAVEAECQVKFLMTQFGVGTAPVTKDSWGDSTGYHNPGYGGGGGLSKAGGKKPGNMEVHPMINSKFTIWGAHLGK